MKIKTLASAVHVACLLLAAFASPAFATTYNLPANGSVLLGSPSSTVSNPGENLIAVAQRFDLGLNAIKDANPSLPTTLILPAGTHINIPSAYLVPPLPHQGIVINLPEMRLYYYSANGIVKTYPIGIGQVGKTIPMRPTTVVRKVKDPIWIPPEDIRAFNEQQGIVLPKVMAAGPDNPLGHYAIYLSIPTYLIHSTIHPDSIGRRASFGCIRMHESDIQDFFPLVTSGTNVLIVDMPTKVGWQGSMLLLETHDPLEEHSTEYNATYQSIVNSIDGAITNKPTMVDWQMVADLSEARDGVPHNIGFRLK